MAVWNVLVEMTEDGKAIATVLELPSVHAIADTREDAITEARKLLAERLAKVEIVSIEVEPADSKLRHPSLKYLGVFKDDPDFEDVQRSVQEHRDEIDALEEEPAITKFIGIFKDDPDFAEIVKGMRAEREQPDEE